MKGSQKPETKMNKNKLYVAIPGLVAAAALVLSFSPQFPVESLIGYVSSLTLVAMLVLEYRRDWIRPYTRS